jgi:transposase-like protein
MSEQSEFEPGTPVGKRAGRSQRRFSVKDRKRLLRLYERSGVSQKQFSREQAIAVSTLSYWVRQSRRPNPRVPRGTVVEVPAAVLAATSPMKSPGGERIAEGVQIRLPNGLELRVAEGAAAAWVVELLQGLLTCSG